MDGNSKGVNVTVAMLHDAANAICQEWWGVDFTGMIVLTDSKWKRINGKYICSRKDPSLQIIMMSRYRNSQRTIKQILRTLLHELVHWRLHQLGKPYRDTDVEFVEECYRVGAPISRARYAQKAALRWKRGARQKDRSQRSVRR